MADNVWAAVDEIVQKALSLYAPVDAIFPESSVQFWNAADESMGDIEDAEDVGDRLWLAPRETDPDYGLSNTHARFTQVYDVGFALDKLDTPSLRKAQGAIFGALTMLYNGKNADGSPLTIPAVSGLTHEVDWTFVLATPVRVDPEREPIGRPRGWNSFCRVEVIFVIHKNKIG